MYLDSNGFKCSVLQNCKESTDGKNPFCKICNSLFYPSIGGVCVDLKMDGCISSSGHNYSCDLCKDLYYLDTDKKCKLGQVTGC